MMTDMSDVHHDDDTPRGVLRQTLIALLVLALVGAVLLFVADRFGRYELRRAAERESAQSLHQSSSISRA